MPLRHCDLDLDLVWLPPPVSVCDQLGFLYLRMVVAAFIYDLLLYVVTRGACRKGGFQAREGRFDVRVRAAEAMRARTRQRTRRRVWRRTCRSAACKLTRIWVALTLLIAEARSVPRCVFSSVPRTSAPNLRTEGARLLAGAVTRAPPPRAPWFSTWTAIGEASNPGPSTGLMSDHYVPVFSRLGGGYSVELYPPEDAAAVREGHQWSDHDLERFLQQCEVDAGWRDSIDCQLRCDGDQRLTEDHHMGAGSFAQPSIDELSDGEMGGGPRAALAMGVDRACDTMHRDGTVSGHAPVLAQPISGPGPAAEPVLVEDVDARSPSDATIGEDDLATLGPMHVPAPPLAHGGQRRMRPRGKRRRQQMSFYLANTSGKPQLLNALDQLRHRRGMTVAVMCQEHLTPFRGLADLQHSTRAIGWKFAPSPAARGKGGGPSAGVGVAVPAQHGWATAGGADTWDLSPPGSPGRIAAAWVQAGCAGGVLVISMYLWDSEGLTPRNMRIVEAAIEAGRAYGGLWIVGGDQNMTPAELSNGLDRLLARADAVVRAPEEPTCYPSTGAPRVLDFYIVDSRLDAGFRSIEVDTSLGLAPHRVVKLTIDATMIGGLASGVQKPKSFPRDRPIGCARRPIVPDSRVGGCQAAAGAAAGGAWDDLDFPMSEDGLQEFWNVLVTCAEHELCGMHDLVGPDGSPLAAYVGRARGLRVVRRPITPPRITGHYGKADRIGHALCWAAVRLQEMTHLATRAAAEGQLPAAALRQWVGLRKIFSRSRGLVAELVRYDAAWGPKFESVATFSLGGDPRAIEVVFNDVTEAMRERKKAQAQRRRAAWKEWVSAQIKRGGGALHRYMKRTLEAPDRPVQTALGPSAAPQDLVDNDLVEWLKVWHKHDGMATAPWRVTQVDTAMALPVPTPRELRRAGGGFKKGTGVGADHIPPRSYAHLSEPLLRATGYFMARAERIGSWPQTLAVLLMHLIPKASGGRRPIALLASILRLWERVRFPIVQRWRDKVRRDWNWAQRGRSAEQAVWTQTVYDEAAGQRGLGTGAALLDLQKAFEHIPLERAWRAGIKHGYPRVVLRMALECCAFQRRLLLRGATSAAAWTLTAVAAGLSYATDLLQLVIMDTMDHISRSFPSVRLCVYIDDIAMHRTGTDAEVTSDLAAATRICIDDLELQCGLVVDRAKEGDKGVKKSVAVASSDALRRRLGVSMRTLGIGIKTKVKHLGVDYKPGKRWLANTAMVGRWAAAFRKKHRAIALGRAGGRHVVRTGLVPSARFGTSVTGVSNAALRSVATAAAQVLGDMHGRSATARLALQGDDPRHGIILRPIMEWTSAIWAMTLPTEIFADAWKFAQKHVGLSRRPHQAVTGGAGTFVAALMRLGWSTPSFDSVRTRDGEILMLGEVEPRVVREYAEADLRLVSAAASAVADDFMDYDGTIGMHRMRVRSVQGAPAVEEAVGANEHERKAIELWRRGKYQHVAGRPVPWFLPAAVFCSRGARGGAYRTAGRATVASLVEGGWWPQARLHAAGISDQAVCQKCKKRVGTIYHRLGECDHPGAAGHRATFLPDWLAKQASTWSWNPLFSRGVPAMPREPPPPSRRPLLGAGWAARRRRGRGRRRLH